MCLFGTIARKNRFCITNKKLSRHALFVNTQIFHFKFSLDPNFKRVVLRACYIQTDFRKIAGSYALRFCEYTAKIRVKSYEMFAMCICTCDFDRWVQLVIFYVLCSVVDALWAKLRTFFCVGVLLLWRPCLQNNWKPVLSNSGVSISVANFCVNQN